MFRFPRIWTMENETDPKSKMPIRSAIKFATKAVKTLYLYVNYTENYERNTVCSVSHAFECNLIAPKQNELPTWCLRSFCGPKIKECFRPQTFLEKSFLSCKHYRKLRSYQAQVLFSTRFYSGK